MKHISRKYLIQYSEDEFKSLTNKKPVTLFERGENKNPIETRYSKGHIGYLHTENNFYIQASPQNIQGKLYFFPEPDPTLIYFSAAQNNLRLLNQYKTDLLPKIDVQSNITNDLIHDFYNYFGAVCGCVIFLFTSLESFMNSMIKENDFYISEKKKQNRNLF